ncbi:MAG: hypothetical protein AB1634_12780, partial [Thermodesulfobacteriota bacterium]
MADSDRLSPFAMGGLEPSSWKTPLALAVALHLVASLAALYLPDLLRRPREMPEVYSVSLFSAAEVGPPATAPTPRPKAAAPAPAPAPKPEPKIEPPKPPEVTVPEPEPP